MRYLKITGCFPPKGKQGESLIQWSKPPWAQCGSWGSPTLWMGQWVPNGGAPGRHSSTVRRQFSKLRSRKYQRFTNLTGKEPSLLGEVAQWFFQSHPAHCKQKLPNDSRVAPSPSCWNWSLLYEIALIKPDSVREKMWLTPRSLYDGNWLEKDLSLRVSSQYLSYFEARYIDEHLFRDFCYLCCETDDE